MDRGYGEVLLKMVSGLARGADEKLNALLLLIEGSCLGSRSKAFDKAREKLLEVAKNEDGAGII
ncbi:MAG: hypothetical protein QXQ39_08345 [Conexivisphaerales archaeon]